MIYLEFFLQQRKNNKKRKKLSCFGLLDRKKAKEKCFK